MGISLLSIYYLSLTVNWVNKYIYEIFIFGFILFNLSVLKNLFLREFELVTFTGFITTLFLAYIVFKNFYHYLVYVFLATLAIILGYFLNYLPQKVTIIFVVFSLVILSVNYTRFISSIRRKDKFLFTNEIVNKGNSLIIATERKGNVVFCSETIATILGYSSEEVLGMKFWELTKDPEFIGEAYHSTFVRDRLYTRKLKCKNGDYKYIQWVDKQFGENLFVGIGHDITEKINLENQYQNLIESARDIIFETDSDGKFIYINSFTSELLGYDIEELKEIYFGELIHDDYKNKIISYYTDEIKNLKNLAIVEFPIYKKNGEIIWISQKISIKRNDNNEIIGYSGISRDITLVKTIEIENIQRQEKIKKYNDVTTKLSVLKFSKFDTTLTLLQIVLENAAKSSNCNRISFWEYNDDYLKCIHLYTLNQTHQQEETILYKKDYPIYFESIEKEKMIIASDVINHFETIEFNKTYFKIHNIKSLLDYPVFIEGKLFGILSLEITDSIRFWDNEDINFARSISEIISIGLETLKRKEIEFNLKYKSEFLTVVSKISEKILISKNIYNEFDAIFEAIGKVTNIDRIYYFENNEISRTACQKFEWVNENIVPQIDNPNLQNVPYELILDIIVPLKAKKLYKKLVKDIYECDYKELLKSQDILSVLVIPLQVQNKTIGFIGFDDCTIERIWSDDEISILQTLVNYISSSVERMQNEAIIHESQERFRLLAENIPGTVYLSKNDEKWTKLYINDEVKNLTGYSKEEFLSNEILFINLIHPDDKVKVIYDQKRALEKGLKIHQEYRIIKKNGEIAWVEEFGDIVKKGDEIDFIEGIFIDITEQKLKEDAIKEKEMAIAANKAKSEFLANMSHEIRTPLNGIVGFTELLMQSDLNKQQNKYMKTVNQSAKSLMGLINDILDFSKIESGNLELNVEEVKLSDLTREVIDTIKFEAIQKKLDVDLHINADVPIRIWIDPIRIKQVLINLLGNAVKFTATGKIKLKITTLNKIDTHQSVVRFSVIDTGIGIKEENQSKIFEAFSQEDSSTTRQFGGTGLGLSISNKILALMNSKLQLTSFPNQGSTFFFDLVVQSSSKDNPDLNFINIEGSEITFVSDKEPNVLIVEDNNINSLLAKTLIRKIIPNSKIHIASNGIEAIENCQSNIFDIIFMDIQMPVMNGYEATIEIRKIINYKSIPIIALTAGTVIGEKEKCLEMGMNDYLSKPIIKGSLEQIISTWVK
ncbi:PAS domain S-box protein [Flavobacterium sp. UBA6135]|uniref:PAS domain S-box protein n=1 Tax=Flavobacterium sp. UBA6135 TaxID=1946553 RepID=UPI0025BBB093|nr:PAS domain S-box protein [Flavobacterium sp. UBA6135]